jgi:hypothetical protein
VVLNLDRLTLMDVTLKGVQNVKPNDSHVTVRNMEIIRKKSILVWLGKEPV